MMSRNKSVAIIICLSFMFSAIFLLYTPSAEALTGGPDGYGYRFTDNTEPGAPAYKWIDITATGNSAWAPGSTVDDNVIQVDPMGGFVFNFYGNTYTGMWVQSNGMLFFTNPTGAFSNQPLPWQDRQFVAPLWDDLYLRSDSRVYWEMQGTAPYRFLVVTFWNFGRFSPRDNSGTFQAIFTENSETIVFQYEDVEAQQYGGNSATVGLNRDSTTAIQYFYGTTNGGLGPIRDGLAITFYTGAGPGFLPWVDFIDDIEGDVSEWIPSSLWHIAEDGVTNYPNSHSPTKSWWYGLESSGTFDTGARNFGRLATPEVLIGHNTELMFWEWYQTEGGTSYDQRWIQIDTGGGWQNVVQLDYSAPNTWQMRTIDLSAYAGNTARIGFWFDTIDGLFNNYRGWYVDDVTITGGVLTDVYDMVVNPTSINRQVEPGTNEDYVYTVTNTGNVADTYNLNYAGPWTVTFLNHIGAASNQVISVAPGETRTFTARIAVPMGVAAGTYTTTITVSSVGHAILSENVQAIGQVAYDFAVTPLDSQVTGDIGSTLDHVFTVTNTESRDVYSISTAGNMWTTQILNQAMNPITTLGPLSNGESRNFIIRVTIPADAPGRVFDHVEVSVTSQGGGTLRTVEATTVSRNRYLETTLLSNNGQQGNMFDVEIKNPLTITNLAINTLGPGNAVTIQLYIKQGSHVGFEQNAGAWTLVSTGNGVSAGGNNPTYIEMDNVPMLAGSYGFYVRISSGPNLRYTNGANVYENDDLKITSGTGNGGLFGTVFRPRIWNGRIYYETLPWTDDIEWNKVGWTAESLWHIAEDGVTNYPNSHSPTRSWWYGREDTGTFNTGARNSGRLATPEIDLRLTTKASLEFWEWYQTEGGTFFDQRWIQINTGGGWENVVQLDYSSPNTWQHRSIDLTPYVGNVVRIGFWFDTIDGILNDYRGWYVDDIIVLPVEGAIPPTGGEPPSPAYRGEPDPPEEPETPVAPEEPEEPETPVVEPVPEEPEEPETPVVEPVPEEPLAPKEEIVPLNPESPSPEESPSDPASPSPSDPSAAPGSPSSPSPTPSVPDSEESKDEDSTITASPGISATVDRTCFAGLIFLIIVVLIAVLIWNEKRRTV